MSDRIDYLLRKTSKPLSFIVFIPEWLEPPTPGLVKMEKSIFNRAYFNIENGKHQYISGSQHLSDIEENNLYTSVHNTRVFILQNENAFKSWPPDKDSINKLKTAMTIWIGEKQQKYFM